MDEELLLRVEQRKWLLEIEYAPGEDAVKIIEMTIHDSEYYINLVGKALAERIVAAKIADNCYFDRGGYRYHGRVKALCEAIRAGGVRI